MGKRQEILQEALAQGGLVVTGRSSARRRAVTRMIGSGQLVWLVPGVACTPGCVDDLAVRLRAVSLWNPDAVVTGRAAACALFWPRLEVPVVDLFVRGSQWTRPGLEAHRCTTLDVDHVVEREGVRFTDAAFTAVWLAPTDGGAAIEAALRSGATTPDLLDRALAAMPNRAGNGVRRELVRWSRHRPWSHFERRVHRILVEAGLTDWEGNWYWCAPGEKTGVVIDIAFIAQKVAIELDGYEFHGSHEAWVRDIRKTNALQLAGWIVLHFTWADLERPECLVEQVRRALRLSHFA